MSILYIEETAMGFASSSNRTLNQCPYTELKLYNFKHGHALPIVQRCSFCNSFISNVQSTDHSAHRGQLAGKSCLFRVVYVCFCLFYVVIFLFIYLFIYLLFLFLFLLLLLLFFFFWGGGGHLILKNFQNKNCDTATCKKTILFTNVLTTVNFVLKPRSSKSERFKPKHFSSRY